MLMKYVAAFLFVIVFVIGNASPALAQSHEVGLQLEAHVDTFCQVWVDRDEQALQFEGDGAQLGSVQEVCNTAGGYTLRATFTNVIEGTVVAGQETALVDGQGSATFAYSEARVRNRDWQLTRARRVVPNAPVFLRLSISPL
jgi:hypothetical protein